MYVVQGMFSEKLVFVGWSALLKIQKFETTPFVLETLLYPISVFIGLSPLRFRLIAQLQRSV